MSNDNTTLAEYLSEHPRMIGALFTVLLLLTQAGNTLAAAASSNAGP